jgi:hypothetical protein
MEVRNFFLVAVLLLRKMLGIRFQFFNGFEVVCPCEEKKGEGKLLDKTINFTNETNSLSAIQSYRH